MYRKLALLAMVVAAGCSGNGSGDDAAPTSAPAAATSDAPASTEAAAPTTDAAASTTEVAPIAAETDYWELPVKDGPRRETTHAVPHIQVDAETVPELVAELQRRLYSIPGVQDRPSEISLPGAQALWLAEDVEVAHPEVFLVGREFAHIHPDGSLHVWMPIDRAFELTEKKWGELHPFVGRVDFWDGMVMIYTPETPENLDVTVGLVIDAYNFVTGSALDPTEY